MTRALAAILSIAASVAAAPATAQTQSWNFRVSLDGRDIGFHRFTLRDRGLDRELTTEARFEVRFLGFAAYRYAHDATERWRGDCLTTIAARTDDNGERSVVSAARDGDLVKIAGGPALEGCVMTFAYWNPAILKQTRLLNSQTGAYETVKVARLGESRLATRGSEVPATHYRVTGSKHPIDLWYSAANEWLALESVVGNGRRLTYRLE